MASIIERHRKNAPSTWQAIIRIAPNPAIARTFDTREEAARFAEETEPKLKVIRKRAVKAVELLRKTNPSFADYQAEELRDALRLFCQSERSIDRHRNTLPTLLANVGGVKLGEIKRAWVKGYIDKMRKKKTRAGRFFSYETLAVHMQIMGMACRWRAEELEIAIPQLPFSTKLFPPNWEVRRERRLNASEEHTLMAEIRKSSSAAKYHWRLLVRLALETGTRLQELVLAEWPEVEISRNLWTLPALHTKTKKARAIPLSKKATRIMRLLRLLSKPGNPRVFHALGQPLSVSAMFHKFVVRAGLKDFRFHDLRHEAISRMVLYKRKLSVFEIMAIVGHSSTEMLVRYANLRGDEMAPRMD